MVDFAEAVGRVVCAGDVLVLTGNLGAGKTTFTQFLARSLDVRGRVSSPTFVIAREHPPRGSGPGLIHADAYRLGGADEFDDLGLDAWLDESVTVVEWGRGMAETLGDHLDVEILRDEDGSDDEFRTVILTAHGEAWTDRLTKLRAHLSVTRGLDRACTPAATGPHPSTEEAP